MKRPFFWAVSGFALGEVLSAWTGDLFTFCILAGMLFCVFSFSLLYKKEVWKKTLMIILLGMLFGIFRMLIAKDAPLAEHFAVNEKTDSDAGERTNERKVRDGEYEITFFKEAHGDAIWVEATGRIVGASLSDGETTDYIVKIEDTVFSGEHIKESYRLLFYGGGDYPIGQKIRLTGLLYCFEDAENPGGFQQKNYYQARNISFYMRNPQAEKIGNDVFWYREKIRRVRLSCAALLSRCAASGDAAVYTGILLGEKGEIDRNLKKIYQMAGIAHILAISGLHISLIAGGLFRLFRKLGTPYFFSVSITLLFAFSYGELTGFSPSTVRALIMLFIWLLGQLIGRSTDLLTDMAAALFIMLLLNPYYLSDGGVQLSFAAVFGVALGKELTDHRMRKQKERNLSKRKRGKSRLPTFLREKAESTIIVSGTLWIVTLPILLNLYYGFSPWSFVINLIAIPLMTPVILSGLCGIFVSCFSVSAGSLCILPGTVILRCYEKLCRFSLSLPFGYLTLGKPHIFQIIIFYGLVFLSGLFLVWKIRGKNIKRKVRGLFSAVLFGLGIFVLLFGKIQKREFVVFLDVGQGDGILLHTESGNNLVIDGGSVSEDRVGETVLLPAMRYYGMGEIDYWFVSHADEDHISGLREILEAYDSSGIKIRNLVFSKEICRDEIYAKLAGLAEKNQIPVLFMSEKDEIRDSTFRMVCRHPDKGFLSADRNQASLVLSYHSAGTNALFTGDTDEKALTYMLGSETKFQIDILKVPHHGSKSSVCDALYELARGKIAVISCGENNFYGHPHRETLERLEAAECKIFTTVKYGAVEIQVKNRYDRQK